MIYIVKPLKSPRLTTACCDTPSPAKSRRLQELPDVAFSQTETAEQPHWGHSKVYPGDVVAPVPPNPARGQDGLSAIVVWTKDTEREEGEHKEIRNHTEPIESQKRKWNAPGLPNTRSSAPAQQRSILSVCQHIHIHLYICNIPCH